MSDSAQSQTQAVQSQATTGAVAATTASTGTGSSTSSPASYSSSTHVNSLSELRTKAPKVYNAMMQGIAMDICNDMKHHQDRLKKLVREASNR